MRIFVNRYRWIALAVIGLALFVATNWLPVANGRDGTKLSVETDRALTKQAAAAAAEAWVKQQTGGTSPFRIVGPVSFQVDTVLSGYLTKEKLAPAYAERYRTLYPVEYWQVEMENSSGARYLVDIEMEKGAVAGWRRQAVGSAPAKEEGQRIAETYLRQNALLPQSYTVRGPDSKHPYRYVFTIPGERIGDAVLEREVEVRGLEVTAYHAGFQAPDAYKAWLDRQESASGGMSRWNLILTAIMALGAIYYAIRLRKVTAFRRGVLLALVFVGLYALNNWNQLPAMQALGFSESPDPFSGHATAIALSIISTLFAAALGLVTYLSLTAGTTMWRVYDGAAWPRWGETEFGRETLRSMGRGYGLALFMLGLQGVMLWIAQAGFGMWSVNDPSSSYYNLLHPGLFPLMAWAAAISEEAIYRLFGVAFFHRLIRHKFIAVLAPSLIWAFNHTLYPIYPVYTRLIEVTLLGLLFGYAMLKYGFLTALFAHAVIDSTLMALPLIGGSDAGLALAGIVYLASPALVAGAIWWWHRRRGARLKSSGSTLPPATPS
ncbi:CPBP family intramembrane glutamic endopeptidase [Paenibacillus sp. HJGM_3]|uniref:CPBP family intramembrane glutamic endopeptidase n=1 Tax=Paenibacillus sp. HJGM_3 TaxID=3379816 RepID=UPI00385FFADF